MTVPAPRVASALKTLREDPDMNAGILAMKDRETEFSSPMAALFAGIAVVPQARQHLDDALDAMWADASRIRPDEFDEVVIGAGLHAAIYCAVRVSKGFRKPLVIEAGPRVGGAFAVSQGSSFYLNSRNRPGDLGLPGTQGGALNVLPGGVVQPADLSGDEYQRNADLAMSIRATLAMYARVVTERRVTQIGPGENGKRHTVLLEDGTKVPANRVIVATGIGDPKADPYRDTFGDKIGDRRIITYPEFMRRLDDRFPLRGIKRVAVIGAGDSGKTAIEGLTGLGPANHWSVAGLDWPEYIDWYGVKNAATCESWEQNNRSRYKSIGRVLPRVINGPARVSRMPRANYWSPGFECATVDERTYDLVVRCDGFAQRPIDGLEDGSKARVGSRTVGATYAPDLFAVGPCAGIPVSSAEREASPALADIPENSTSLFRYAGRTAALAASLPTPTPAFKPVRIGGGTATVSAGVTALRGLARLGAEDPREVLGTDTNGVPIRAGDYVRRVGRDGEEPGIVYGVTDKEPRKYIATSFPRGGFKVQGFPLTEAYGVRPGDLEVVPSPVIAKDKTGRPIYVGSRLRGNGDGQITRGKVYTGTVLGLARSSSGSGIRSRLVIGRDDKKSGGGATWGGQAGWLTDANLMDVIDEPVPAPEELARDQDGKPIYAGSRVKSKSSGNRKNSEPEYTGTVIGLDKTQRDLVVIKRDDGDMGGGRTADGQAGWIVVPEYTKVQPEQLPVSAEDFDTRKDTGLKDSAGKPIKVGDEVTVTESSRFGTVRGRVTGSDGRRVVMDLNLRTATEGKAADTEVGYKASTGRVKVYEDMPF